MRLTTRSNLFVHARALLLAGSAALAATGACSSSDERQRAIQIAGGCLINSDCDELLICAFGRCHEACDEDRDCERDLRCVKSEKPGIFVCQLEDETVCKSNDHCPGDQVCGVDLECRDSCKDDGDCLESTQVCSESNECASTDTKKDMLDESRMIIPFDPDSSGGGGGNGGSGATGATGGMAGTSGNGASAGTGAGGSGGTEPTPSGGAGGEPPITGDAGSGNQGGAPPDPEVDFEEPDGPEVVDNDTREKAVAIQTSARLHIAGSNEDWLSYTAPNDGRAHIISVHLEQAAGVGTVLNVLSGVDYSPIGVASPAEGSFYDVYFSIGSGTKVLLTFRSAGTGSPGRLSLTLEDTPELDAYEPNNDYDEAALIELGEVVEGQLLVPYVTEAEIPKADWFEIELGAGTATLELLTVPDQGQFQVIARDANGKLTVLGTTDAGAIRMFTLPAGTRQFQILPYAKTVLSYATPVKPAYFSQQYSFRVTQ